MHTEKAKEKIPEELQNQTKPHRTSYFKCGKRMKGKEVYE